MDSSMLIYITGGARSGKSHHAINLAKKLARRVVYVATTVPNDDDLRERVQHHKRERPRHWRTIEDRLDLWKLFSEFKGRADLILIDCLTMYVAGRLVDGESGAQIKARVEKICKAAVASKLTTILVSNEIGSGVVPPTDWGRRFRDDLGRANQIAARNADEAVVLVSGIPLVLKGQKK